jgi:hypothetical protein
MPAPAQLLEDLSRLHDCELDATIVEGHPRYYVVIANLELPSFYAPAMTDLMMMADYQYPMSALDMFWTSPHVRRADSGAFPANADQFEQHIGRHWQRWSWHYGGWNPARHNLVTHLDVFFDRLAKAA